MKKMPKLVAALLVLLAVLMITSCGDGGMPDTPDAPPADERYDVTVFEPGKPLFVVTSASADTDTAALAEELIAALKAVGVDARAISDMYGENEYELVLGNTSRPATEYAAASMADRITVGDGGTAYVICVNNDSLAINGIDTASLRAAVECFKEFYLTSDKLVLASDFDYFYELSEEDEKDMKWEKRWDEIEALYGSKITNSLKKLYSFYGDGVYKWIANLYSPETGGFYYSNSARDHEGFLPDIESTTQALWLISDSGLIDGKGGLTKALPADVVSDTLAFAYSLFDESDGYFYHPQWGKNINSSRRGRDLNSSIDVIKKMGGKTPDNTALDRLGNTSAQSAILKLMNSTVSPVGFLDSEAELLVWLESLGINTNSHSAGHTIESSASQIKAKGYADTVLSWLDSKQLDSGLWQTLTPDNQYTALSGLLKIGSCYSKLGGYMKRCEEMVDTSISVILSDADPYIVIYVYNPWGGLEYALKSMQQANAEGADYDIDAAYERVYAAFPSMIDATVAKLAKFQKPDGSFSYYQTASAAYTQGTLVSLGYDEGDVNGTSLGLTTVRKTVFALLGVSPVPMYNGEDYEIFYGIISSLTPVEKLPMPDLSASFESGEMPPSVTTYSTGSSSTVEIVPTVDREGNDGKALHIVSPSGIGDGVTFNPKLSEAGMSVFTFDFDIMINSGNSYSHQISMLDPTGSIAYMLTAHVYGDTVAFKDTTSSSHQANAKDWGVTAKVGEWIHIRLEYHVESDETVKIYAYINGQCSGYSDHFYGRFASNGSENSGARPKTAIGRLQIYSMMGSNGEYYLDNISAEFLSEASAE